MKEPTQQKRILFVEDDGDLRKVVSDYLEGLGFYVITAARGKCASRMIEKLPPDLALIDVRLPDMSGLEICKWVKKEKTLANVPIIIISGGTGLQDKLKGYLSGAERYLCKPFDMKDLGMEIITLLESTGNKANSLFEDKFSEIRESP